MIFSINTATFPRVSYIGFVSLKQDWQHFYRKVDEYILYFVTEGEMYIRENESKYHLKKGDLIILEPNLEHVGFKNSSCDFYFVHFKYDDYLKKMEHIEDLKESIMNYRKESFVSYPEDYHLFEAPFTYVPKLFHVNNHLKFDLFKKILDDVIEEYVYKYENYKVLASTVILQLFIYLNREFITTEFDKHKLEFSKINTTINAVIKYINSNTYKKFNREEFESEFEFNYDYLNRQFKKVTGYTIGKYFLTQKINKAMTLLKTTNIKISEIAYLVGIDDPYYFSKVFKAQTGISPTEYYNAVNQNKVRLIENEELKEHESRE